MTSFVQSEPKRSSQHAMTCSDPAIRSLYHAADSLDARVLSLLDSFTHCILRDGHDAQALATSDEWDLLIAPDEREALIGALQTMGFLKMPSAGYAPHTFLLMYDERSDRWLKLDLVDRIDFGSRYAVLRSSLAEHVLRDRRPIEGRWVPGPDAELVCLLLHGLLDKKNISQARRDRLRDLVQQRDHTQPWAPALLDAFPNKIIWKSCVEDIQTRSWDKLESRRQQLLAAFSSTEPVAQGLRRLQQQFLRMAQRVFGWRSPRTPLLAFLAPDGAGKSTLISRLEHQIAWPTRTVYLGLYQRSAPKDNATSSSVRTTKHRFPSLLVRSWKQYLHARRLQAANQIVLCDRYTTDALLSQPARQSWRKTIRRWLLGHSCPLPDLTIILDAPGSLLFARKGEHDVEWLEQQRQSYLQLANQLPRCVTVDATRDLDSVQRDLSRVIWQLLRQRNGGAR